MRHPPMLAVTLLLAVSALALTAWSAPAPQPPARSAEAQPPAAQDVSTILAHAGYTGVRKLQYKHGLWKAKAVDADGRYAEVRVDAATGRIYPEHAIPALSGRDVMARLDAAGYRNIRKLEFDDGLWKVYATDREGRRVKLRLDPDSGSVISSEARHRRTP